MSGAKKPGTPEKKKPTPQDSGWKDAARAFSMLGGVGIYLVLFVGICIAIGAKADAVFGLGHAGKLCGILLGFPGAIYTLYRQLRNGKMP